MSDKIIHVTDSDFEQKVLNADGPVLIDYWAEWCGPGKMIAPLINELADEFDGKLTVAKMDIDSNRQTPMNSWKKTSDKTRPGICERRPGLRHID